MRVAKPERAVTLEAQTHRRFLKTHLPVDALVFSPKAKYIYIGRDGRDVAWSLFNHYANASDAYFKLFNDAPGRIGPPLERVTGDVHDFYGRWFSENGYPLLCPSGKTSARGGIFASFPMLSCSISMT